MKLFTLNYLAETNQFVSKLQEILAFVESIFKNPFIKVLISTLIFILLWGVFGKIIKKSRKRRMAKTQDKLLTSVIHTALLWAIRILLIIAYAGTVGIDTAGLAALVASAGVAIGLAIQGSLSNLAGGIVLIITRPFQIGDYIEANGVDGTVEDIQLFYTNLVSPDNKVILIPNGTISNNTIINYSRKELRRVDLSFIVLASENENFIIEKIKEICADHSLILKDPEQIIRLGSKENGLTTIQVRPWCKNEDYWTVYFDLINSINQMFKDNNIVCPNPQVDVHNK